MCVLYYLWFELQHLLSTPSSLCMGGRENRVKRSCFLRREREGGSEGVLCVAGWDFSRLNRKTLREKKDHITLRVSTIKLLLLLSSSCGQKHFGLTMRVMGQFSWAVSFKGGSGGIKVGWSRILHYVFFSAMSSLGKWYKDCQQIRITIVGFLLLRLLLFFQLLFLTEICYKIKNWRKYYSYK